MKKLVLMILMIAIVVSAFAQDKMVTLKLGHYSAESHAMHLASVMLAENVAKRSNGTIKIDIFPNSKLGSSQEMVEQATLGAIDFVLPTEPALAKWSPKVNLVTGPFAFKDYAAVDKFFAGDSFVAWIKPDLDKANLQYIARWEYGFRTYTNSKRPIVKPEDFKGLKIRTPPDFVNQETVKALGGIVQTIAFAELPMALKQGVVDGQENPIATIYAGKMWETQKYLSILNYTYVATHLIMNKASFNKLSANQQKILVEEAVKAGQFMQKTIREGEKAQIEELVKNGMEVNSPDTTAFQAGTISVWDTLKSKVSEADWKAFQTMLAASK
ncbi:MAG: TRAP transporter substrate-binding protein [Rectinemataceae bacterium]|nr:TRAP transporter substrate-binding protein [Rectinemataceae bacterium]